MEIYTFEEPSVLVDKRWQKPIQYRITEKGCWEVVSHAKQTDGYHVIRRAWINKKIITIHRYSYLIHKGEIAPNLVVMHSCDNRSCCNPDHLSLGTIADNMADMYAKGRNVPPRTRGSKHGNAKLTEEQVLSIREDTRKQADIAKEYGIHYSLVSLIKSRRKWAHL